jgi:hypothetical protein
MTTEEVIKLGRRELAKKEAKKEKHKAFGIVADKFVQLAQEALNECKACSIVAWSYKGEVGGEIFGETKYNPYCSGIRIIDVLVGLAGTAPFSYSAKTCGKDNHADHMIVASFKVGSTSGYCSYREAGIDWGRVVEIWPFVSTWEGKLINKAARDLGLVVPEDVVLSFRYMDCRGVTGIRKVGSRIKKFI